MASRRNIVLLAVGAIVLIALAVGGTLVVVSMGAQKHSAPSDGELFVYDATPALAEDGRQFAWGDFANASPSDADPVAPIICPEGSTSAAAFVAAPGSERSPVGWTMWSFFGELIDGRSIVFGPLTLGRLDSGLGEATKAVGGTFSVGLACTTNNNLDVTAAYYRAITIRPGGTWTLEPLN
jgi:hypothetical protein